MNFKIMLFTVHNLQVYFKIYCCFNEGKHILPKPKVSPISNKVNFIMTVNKPQGETFNMAGVDIWRECFSYGQLHISQQYEIFSC